MLHDKTQRSDTYNNANYITQTQEFVSKLICKICELNPVLYAREVKVVKNKTELKYFFIMNRF